MSQTVFSLTSNLTGPGVLTTQKLVTKRERIFLEHKGVMGSWQ